PKCKAHGGSIHARGKRPPAVEINNLSSYPKNTDLRTNIYFAPERLLRYSTDTFCTPKRGAGAAVVYFQSGMLLRIYINYEVVKQQFFLARASNLSPKTYERA